MRTSGFVVLLAMTLFAVPASAGKPRTPKLCWIGSSGSYLAENEVCIDTLSKCERAHGVWLGTVDGRGRQTGCDLPTKDAGHKCADSSACTSICVAHDMSNMNCSCYGRTIVPKGQQPDECSLHGVIPGALVD